VISGNKTVEAARAAGMTSIAVIETDGSSLVAVQRGDLDLKKDKKAKELAIADNRVSEVDLDWNNMIPKAASYLIAIFLFTLLPRLESHLSRPTSSRASQTFPARKIR